MSMSTRDARRRWQHAGLDCATIDSGIGFINGYVRLTDDHVARHCTYDQINRSVSAHGGLTYGVDEDGWVGFDTGHGGDYWPGLTDRNMFGPAERVWGIERLDAEVEHLAEQLAAMTEVALPDSLWDCTEDEFRRISREAAAWRRLKASREVTR